MATKDGKEKVGFSLPRRTVALIAELEREVEARKDTVELGRGEGRGFKSQVVAACIEAAFHAVHRRIQQEGIAFLFQ